MLGENLRIQQPDVLQEELRVRVVYVVYVVLEPLRLGVGVGVDTRRKSLMNDHSPSSEAL